VSAPARLLSVRLQGFKSFAERTHVEFGPGISAVVGPNGSGKSNLADALRWALGEQGRSLRTRKSEDVIFAGSERRAALGMADVTLVLDNADGLLPVDYSVVELGRRLYRSGENDYLLNRQRVRLRDLVDLLDAAHLAENAFLFIGQGMVDQALALRPEERRPLFEEVAGVRRPERRRRKAEEQLAEAEANLARVEDVLAELRPQARRLAAQAEQQASRASAGDDLASALVAMAHARWHDAARRMASALDGKVTADGEADRRMAELAAAEDLAAAIAGELASAVAVETERRGRHEEAMRALTELRLEDARLAAEAAAVGRDRTRLIDERQAAEADLTFQRRALAAPVPERDVQLEAAVAEADRSLTEALAELGALRASERARGEELAALRRAEAARVAEAETARRRLAEAERLAGEETARTARLEVDMAGLEDAARIATDILADAITAEATAAASVERATAAVAAAEASQRAATQRAATTSSTAAAARARLEALARQLLDDEQRTIARSARRRGGRRVDEDLVVDPEFRAAVEAALAETARAYVVAPTDVAALVDERGLLVTAVGEERRDRGAERLRDAVAAAGGGPLPAAIRRDPVGAATGLLARAVWLPDLAACLALQPSLPPGWIAVPRDGSAALTDQTVALGRPDPVIERRAEHARLRPELERLDDEADGARAALEAATSVTDAAIVDLQAARADHATAAAARRRAEEAERIATRALESAVREAAWGAAQRDRLTREAAGLRVEFERNSTPEATPPAESPSDRHAAAILSWETRLAEIRARRDRLAADLARRDETRRDADARKAAASAAARLDEQRIAAADRALAELADRELQQRDLARQRAASLTAAVEVEAAARADLEAVRAADTAARERLAVAETEAHTARERLRAAEDRRRHAEREDLEARLAVDSLRQQLLVDLATLGELGLRALGARRQAGPSTAVVVDEAADGGDETGDDGESGELDAAFDLAAGRWASEPPRADPPSPGRLAHLRRRFHELGAANPFAVEEYRELRARVEAMESQEGDLRAALAATRQLIDDLNRMIADQFTMTFRALEAAFDARFRQLFGGGFARLSLTEPEDLSATGVEIVARPPGKKAQALAMLSGGERALTAVALLFAMLEVRPVPFCVLDEVDAALDEANIGRFTDALRGLAERTQFVIITHNRGTIEQADAMYGVTAGDDSVSRVISLRLDEAQAIAERGRAEPVGAG
jgi:chromosome segregation protein